MIKCFFFEVIHRWNLTLNETQTKMSVPFINILGYQVGNGIIKPDDADRLRPLQELPLPANLKSLCRTLGMFAYYAKWIPHFSDKIKPLVNVQSFPLDDMHFHHLVLLMKVYLLLLNAMPLM